MAERIRGDDEGKDSGMVGLGPYAGGMNNIDSESQLPDGQLREALNVDITRTGSIRRRAGWNKVMSITGGHSGYSDQSQMVCIDNGRLVRIDPDNGTKVDLGEMEGDQYVSYDSLLGKIYLTNQVRLKSVSPTDTAYRPIGCPSPNGLPTVLPGSGGALIAGWYSVVISYRNEAGEESGADAGVFVQIGNDGGKLVLSDIPQPPAEDMVSEILVWMSAPDDDGKPYLQVALPVGTTSTELVQFIRGRRRLDVQFLDDLPPGHILRFHNGRLFVAVDNTFYYSEPWTYWLTSLDENHGPMAGERIAIMEPVDDGVFISAGSETLFFGGSNPEDFNPRSVFGYPAVEGSGARVHPNNLGSTEEYVGDKPVAYWFTSRGGVLGFPGGNVKAMSDSSLSVPEYERGASMYVEGNGLRKVLTSTMNRKTSTAAVVADDAVEFIIKKQTP